MGTGATADVVVRSRQKGAKVYEQVQNRLDAINRRAKQLGATTAAAAIGGVAFLTAKSFESADALAKQADRIGTTTEKLKTLQLLNELAGGSNENLTRSMIKAQKALGEFSITGSGTAAPFLKALNLDTQKLANLRPDELFQVYAEQIRNMGNRSEQAAASAALFGDRTGEMLNLIDQGPAAFAETEAEVRRYAIALNRVDSAKIEQANDTITKLRERMVGVGNVIASKVAPVVTAIANRFLDSGTEAGEMGNKVDQVMNGISIGAGIVADAIFGWKLLFAATRIGALEFSAHMISGFARIERAIAIVRNKMSEAFGGEFVDVRGGFLTQVEDSLRASSKHAKGVLSKLAASEKPSIALGRALAQARVHAEATAQATAATRDRLQEINLPDTVNADKETAAREHAAESDERFRQRLASKLEAVQASLRTETESEVFAFQERHKILELSFENELVTKERFMEIEASLRERHEQRLTDITLKGLSDRHRFEAKSGKEKAKQIFGDLTTITQGVATHNKTLFRINQAAAIGNAIVNTAEGVTKTLSAYPMPLAAALATAHLAAGVAQIGAIRSAQPGGGSTPSAIGTAPALNDQPILPFGQGQASGTPPPGSSVTIIVEGSLIGDEGIREVLGGTIRELVDADEIFISPNSRQAEEIRSGTGSGG
ncbi:MAG: hypothetical protein K0U72_09730 [Gammaproteobacteria bacterium]|nr:hypothetical protein [Gammaproteobacteria bacterium]